MSKNVSLQGGEDPLDALSCRSIFAKEPQIIGLFCAEWPIKMRHHMGLRHPVHNTRYKRKCKQVSRYMLEYIIFMSIYICYACCRSDTFLFLFWWRQLNTYVDGHGWSCAYVCVEYGFFCRALLQKRPVIIRICIQYIYNTYVKCHLTNRWVMGWLRWVGSLKLQVSFTEYSLFYRALLQKKPVILRSLQSRSIIMGGLVDMFVWYVWICVQAMVLWICLCWICLCGSCAYVYRPWSCGYVYVEYVCVARVHMCIGRGLVDMFVLNMLVWFVCICV